MVVLEVPLLVEMLYEQFVVLSFHNIDADSSSNEDAGRENKQEGGGDIV